MSAQNRKSGLDQESDLKSFRKLSDTKIYAAESGTALISIKQPQQVNEHFYYTT